MFKIEVLKNELLKALKKIDAVRNEKSSVDILKMVKIETLENDKIKLTTTTLENTLEVVIDARIETHGAVILPNVKNIIKSLKFLSDWVTISTNEENIIIKDDKKEIVNIKYNASEFPESPTLEVENVYNYDNLELLKRINTCSYAVSSDDTRPILTGLHFNNSDIVAIDGYRLVVSSDCNLNIIDNFTINHECIKVLKKLLKTKKSYNLVVSTSKNIIVFKFDNIKLTSNLLQGEFIKYQQLIQTETKSFDINNKADFIENIDFLLASNNSTENTIINTLDTEFLKMEIQDDTGLYKTKNVLNDTSKKDSIQFAINGKYFIDAFKNITSDFIEFNYSMPVAPIILKCENETHLVLPVRMKN